ncbi:hypothetical protein BC941DRAFT_475228 [Chlamydoabsidia padenii]|nr:hypothetical protein BC941DRAFT_475228 [Chlamydoabsidia padenii]
MKKFFGGKKKKKSKASSFISADSDYQVNDTVPRNLKMSQSTEQPRIPLSTDISNMNGSTDSKNLQHSKSQGIMKTTLPAHQPTMAKRLNRPTSSPPALVMPRPRYAEPPTRAVLKSFDHEKTLLDLDQGQEHQGGGEHTNRGGDDLESRKIPITTMTRQMDLNQEIQLLPSLSAPIPTKPKKVSPITAPPQQQQYDIRSTIKSKKSFDGAIAMATAKKHESMNSITGSDDSNRVYESALESPMASTSTILDNPGSTNGTVFGLGQAHRHSPPSHSGNTLVPSLLPPTASDSSETVTPAGSTNQYQRALASEQVSVGSISSIDITKAPLPPPNTNPPNLTDTLPTHIPILQQRPQPISPTRNHQDLDPTLQQLLPSEDLETLQQQVLLIQQQREMDRLEYERMEQVHKERTKWMKAEIDRTQSKLLELTAQKRGYLASQQHGDNEAVLSSPSFGNQHDQVPDISKSASYQYPTSTSRETSGDESIRRHHQQQYDHNYSSASSTPSRIHKSKSGDLHLSRSSSKTSTGTGSSLGKAGYRPKENGKPIQQQTPTIRPSTMDDERQRGSSYRAECGDSASYGNLSRQSSGRKSQQSQRQDYQQQVQNSPSYKLKGSAPSTPRTQPRQGRPRSKSTDTRPPPPPMAPEFDYHPDYYDEQQPTRSSRPRSRDSRPRHQRSHSVERSQPVFYPPNPYFYPPPGVFEDDLGHDDELDDEGDGDDYLDEDYMYSSPRYDSFPPRYRQRMRHPIAPMPFIPPPYTNRRMPPSMMSPMDMQPGFYDYDGPPSPYYPIRRRQQQQQQPGMLPNDDGYWPPPSSGPPPPSFARYSQNMPQYMRMDDQQRRMGPPYWRGRGRVSPSEFAS